MHICNEFVEVDALCAFKIYLVFDCTGAVNPKGIRKGRGVREVNPGDLGYGLQR